MKLSCECGKVTGEIVNANANSGIRVVCCCDDCQTFANHLNKTDQTLDEFGGTEIYQTSQSQVVIHTGLDQLQCLRLKPKGLLRWYTGCCNTPVANTVSAGMPFAGMINTFWHKDNNPDADIGPVRAYVQTQHATGTPTYPKASAKFPLGITLHIMRKMLGWKVRGMSKPSVFFKDGRPAVKPVLVFENTEVG